LLFYKSFLDVTTQRDETLCDVILMLSDHIKKKSAAFCKAEEVNRPLSNAVGCIKTSGRVKLINTTLLSCRGGSADPQLEVEGAKPDNRKK